MASTKPGPLKELGEHLQEQQEPFILNTYLLEKSYSTRSMNSGDNLISESCPDDRLDGILKRSASCVVRKKEKGISRLLKAVYNKFVKMNVNQRVQNSHRKDGKSGTSSTTGLKSDKQEVAEADKFSSASSTTVFNSCSESDTEEFSKDSILSASDITENQTDTKEPEVITDKQITCRCKGNDGKQLSPVSILEEIPSQEGSALPNRSLWGSLPHSGANVQGQQEHCRSKKILEHQPKQFLLDCVREVLEAHRRRTKQHCREFLGCEEIEKRLCDKLIAWEAQRVKETKLMVIDFPDSAVKWNDFENEKKNIASDIGDGILEVIRDDIARDLVNLCGDITMYSHL